MNISYWEPVVEKSNIIFFDCETTGLLKAETAPIGLQPYITELYAVKTDDNCNQIATYHQMFKPPITFEEHNAKKTGITDITGITNAMLKDKKAFPEHWREIADFFLGTTTMVAHNISYDRGCLFYELKRINRLQNFPWPPVHECTIEQSMSLQGHRLNLQKLHTHLFGEPFVGAHRAQSDVEAMLKCYKKMNKKGEFAA